MQDLVVLKTDKIMKILLLLKLLHCKYMQLVLS